MEGWIPATSVGMTDLGVRVDGEFEFQISFGGRDMEHASYELIRYPSGQLVLTRIGASSSGPRDIVGVYTSEAEAQRVLDRLQPAGNARPRMPAAAPLRG